MAGRTFRVFVSSTFSDLKAERNALAQWVFPRLRELCESRGYKFQAVDLRWGVRDEAAADQQTVRICLDEIARCQRLSPRPNFIVLLGDRYGWSPPPYVIPADELQALREWIALDSEEERLVFGEPAASEDLDAVTKHGWYRRDDNAVPAEYVLQPRRDEFGNHGAWEPIERKLRQALANAAERAGLGEDARRKYVASATELEIMKGAVAKADAREHVFAFYRSIANLADVEAALPAESTKEVVDTLPDGTWDGKAWEAQRRLKELLCGAIGDGNVWRYEARWDGAAQALDFGGTLTESSDGLGLPASEAARADTGVLCEAVWQRLSRVIVREMDALDLDNHDPLEVERRAHAELAAERRRVFVGRREPLARIAAYLAGGPARPLVVHGPSGSGKSALMARAVAEARAAHPGPVIVERYIGASPGASEIRALLESVCHEVTRAFGGDDRAIGDYPTLVAELPKRLALATAERPLIVFLDALDQLGETDEGRRLAWMPRGLPPSVRLVVSTSEDDKYQCFPALRAGADDGDLVRVEPLSKREGQEILSAWLGLAARRVTRTQAALVLARFEREGSPLYLKLAFEEARRWHSYDGDAPAVALAGDVAGMIRAQFARLSEGAEHGALVASRALACLAAARYGISDDEMMDLLWRDEAVRAEFQQHARRHHSLPAGMDALPPIVWSRMYFDLEPYLTEREIFGVRLLSFYHRQLGEVAAEQYLDAPSLPRRARVHADLADYFSARWQRPDTHALLELINQLVCSGREGEGRELLLRYEWLDKKVTATSIHFLLDDYAELRLDRRDSAALVGGALRLSANALVARPEELSSQLLGRLMDSNAEAIVQLVEAGRASARAPALLPRWRRLDAPAGPLYRTISTDDDMASVDSIAITPDGKTVVSGVGLELWIWDLASGQQLHRTRMGFATRALAANPDGRTFVSMSGNIWDKTIKVWDCTSGRLLRALQDPIGNKTALSALALAADGRTAVTGSDDRTLKLWDLESGDLLRTIDTRFPTRAVAIGPDGKTILSASESEQDKTLKVWDLDSGRLLRTIDCDAYGVRSFVVTVDGRIVIASPNDKRVKIWDLESGVLLKMLVGHRSRIYALAVTADGSTVISGSQDKTIKVWDLASGRLAQTLTGHGEWITAVAVTPDGATLLSGANDQTLKVWDLHSKVGGRIDEWHQGDVYDVAVTADGRQAVSASGDGTAKVWEVDSGSLVATTDGHSEEVSAVRITPDGRTLVSGSWSGQIRIWDVASGRLLRSLKGHKHQVEAVAVAPDGRTAFSGSYDSTIKVWDLASGRVLRTIKRRQEGIGTVAFTRDCKLAVAGASDQTLKVWELSTGKLLRTFDVPIPEWIFALALTPDGKTAVTGSQTGKLLVWDLDSRGLLRSMQVEGLYSVGGVAVTDDARIAVSAFDDHTLRLWDVGSSQLLATFTGDVAFKALALAPGGNRVVAGDAVGRVHLFDLLLPRSYECAPPPNPPSASDAGPAPPKRGWLRRVFGLA